jgi:amino acid permease
MANMDSSLANGIIRPDEEQSPYQQDSSVAHDSKDGDHGDQKTSGIMQGAMANLHEEDVLMGDKQVGEEGLEATVEEGGASVASTLLNLLKSIIGAGILGIPLALQRLGYAIGLLAMSAAALLSFFGLYLLAIVIHRHGRGSTFSSVARRHYPQRRAMLILLDAAIVVKCLGVGMSYLSIVGDVFPEVLAGIFGPQVLERRPWLGRKPLWVASATLLLTPLVCMHRIDSLKYTSLFGLLGVVYLLGLSVYQVATKGVGSVRAVAPPTLLGLTSFAVFVFAFTCHQNLFPIQNEARQSGVRPMTGILAAAVAVSFACYGAFGVLSSLANPELRDKVLSSYPLQEWPYILARAFYVVLLTFSFPLQSFPTRLSALNIIHTIKPFGSPSEGTDVRHGKLHYWLVTLSILMISGVIASLPVSLDTFLTIVGSTSSPVICYLLPALLFLKDDEQLRAEGGGCHWALRRAAQLLMVFSIVLCLGCSALAVVKIILAARK